MTNIRKTVCIAIFMLISIGIAPTQAASASGKLVLPTGEYWKLESVKPSLPIPVDGWIEFKSNSRSRMAIGLCKMVNVGYVRSGSLIAITRPQSPLSDPTQPTPSPGIGCDPYEERVGQILISRIRVTASSRTLQLRSDFDSYVFTFTRVKGSLEAEPAV